MRRALVSLLAALTLSASTSPPALAKDIPDADSAIVQVICVANGYTMAGTAVQVSPGAFLTANHVVAAGSCTVKGNPITITHVDKEKDFATFVSVAAPSSYEIDCSGYERGEIYLARGYAFGQSSLWAEPLIFSGWTFGRKWSTFTGNVFPGMSGGPLISYDGKVVGIVNARNPSSSLSLSETRVCNGDG